MTLLWAEVEGGGLHARVPVEEAATGAHVEEPDRLVFVDTLIGPPTRVPRARQHVSRNGHAPINTLPDPCALAKFGRCGCVTFERAVVSAVGRGLFGHRCAALVAQETMVAYKHRVQLRLVARSQRSSGHLSQLTPAPHVCRPPGVD